MNNFKTPSIVAVALSIALGSILVTPNLARAEVRTDGTLSLNDPMCPYKAGTREHVIGVKLKAGQTYVIDLMSTAFDPYLYLEDNTGKRLRSNDDGGVGLNSRIVFTPTRSGTYRIVVSSYATNATGSFTLRVSP